MDGDSEADTVDLDEIPDNFELCLFSIQPYDAGAYLGSGNRTVCYGDIIRLQHVTSLKYVSALKRDWAHKETSKRRVSLAPGDSQVDMRYEAENLEAFNENFKDSKYIVFPKPVKELCGKQVLVESKIDGKPLSQYYITADDPVDEAHAHLARCGADLVFQMVLTDNFFHADIHPGNILVGWFPNDPLPFLGMLDVGVTQTLTQHQRDVSHKFMASIVRKDWDDTTKYILEMGGEQPYCDKAAFIRDVSAHCERMMPHKIPKTWEETFWHYGRKYGVLAHAAKKTGFATDFVQGIFNLIQEHKVRIEPPYASLLFSCLMMEFIANQVDPKMDAIQYSAPWFVSNAYRSPKRLAV
mmetsp:Transcript_3192/g.6083  ORF Transcript_3192/g.6083 Transcript_3192/m.6083 type:complete len:354 (-) Transcript_3192:1168-2229(-)